MSENFSLDETIAKLKAEAQEALKNVIVENKQRFENNLASRQRHLIEKLNPHLVKFNVGGHKFVTTLDTLSNIGGNKLHKMVTGRYPIALDKKNRIFLDRNGQYFGYVLDSLRKGKVELPSDSFLSGRIQKEYEFFGLVNVVGSSSSQKEETKVDKIGAKTAITTVLQATNLAPIPKSPAANTLAFQTSATIPSKPIQGDYIWRFSSQIEGELGTDSGPDGIMVKAEELERHTIGDTLLTSGTHQWRFLVEPTGPLILPNGVKNKLYCEGVLAFGVVTKQVWEMVKDTGYYDMMCGFNTFGETFKAATVAKKKTGLKIDGPNQITEITCQNKEITLTFNTQSGVLKLTFKDQNGQEKSHMLRIHDSDGNEYYPYFHFSDARIRLLETKELNESEIDGMDFIMEKAIYKDSEDDESDYEDVESDEEEDCV